MPMYRDAIDNEFIRKSVTLSRWLERLAETQNINFSEVLQDALMNKPIWVITRTGFISGEPL